LDGLILLLRIGLLIRLLNWGALRERSRRTSEQTAEGKHVSRHDVPRDLPHHLPPNGLRPDLQHISAAAARFIEH